MSEGNRKKEAKKYKNKCRRLRVGAPLSRRLGRRPLPARERELFGKAGTVSYKGEVDYFCSKGWAW